MISEDFFLLTISVFCYVTMMQKILSGRKTTDSINSYEKSGSSYAKEGYKLGKKRII